MRCRRPEVVCYCRFATPIETRTRVVILQHPRERHVPINTARIAPLCLPNAELHVGIDWSARPDFDDRAILLYPGPGARDIEAEPPAGPVTLVVVDGTWSQAKTVVRDNPRLAALPRYAFRPRSPSDYRIRKEPHEDCVSTIEALAHVLGVLEGDRERMRGILAPFRAMVDAQLAYSGRGEGRHPRFVRKKRLVPERDPRERLPRELLERGDDLVCIAGEANAWPYGSRERAEHPDEIVHVVAQRVATGERFDVLVRPRSPLSPSVAFQIGVPGERVLAGVTREALESAWARFVRPTDVACTWGTYASKLFRPRMSAHVDVRRAARSWAADKVGTMDLLLRRLAVDVDLPAAPRANRRLAQLVAIVRRLVTATTLPRCSNMTPRRTSPLEVHGHVGDDRRLGVRPIEPGGLDRDLAGAADEPLADERGERGRPAEGGELGLCEALEAGVAEREGERGVALVGAAVEPQPKRCKSGMHDA